MNTTKLTTLLLLSSTTLFAQSNYEDGFIINLNDSKIPLQVKFEDWSSNPNKIEVIQDGEKKQYSPKEIKGFGTNNGQLYLSYNGKIDVSSQFYNQLTESREPIWKEESTFLKTIVKGNTNLLMHDNNNIVTFYYQSSNNNIQPLIYKIYNDKVSVKKNEQFKNQLRANVHCGTTNWNKLKYSKSDLENYFIKYNTCVSGDEGTSAKTVNNTKSVIEFGVQVGIRNENNKIAFPFLDIEHEFKGTSPTVGVNAEYQFPFLKNRYALAIEANYFHFKRQEVEVNPRFGMGMERKIIEVPVGIKYYIKNNDEHKVFIDAYYNAKINLSSANYAEALYSESFKQELSNISSFSFGLGYQWKNLGIKGRYNFNSSFDVGKYMLGETSSVSLNVFYKFSRLTF